MACAVVKPEDPHTGHSQDETEKYLARTLLDYEHYTMIHQALASRWDRLHSLSAAIKLMENYGVTLSAEEVERLKRLEEGQQINALVMKMPQQSNEQFQQFFLQLQLLVSTATRVRRALEEGRPDFVEAALDDADSTGIAPYILRMAIVQAGSEVETLRQQYTSYMREADERCGKLIRGQEDALQAQKRLASASAQLALYKIGQTDKVKAVMVNFAAQSAKGLLAAVVKAWHSYVKQSRLDDEICKELKDHLEGVTARLAALREKQLGSARGMLMRKAMNHESQVVREIWQTWVIEVKEAKERIESAGQIREMEEKLGKMQSSQSENVKKVMMRMNADTEFTLLGMVFQAFVSFHLEYAKNKEMEDQVKHSEQKIAQFMASQSKGAKSVLSKMGGATDSGLVRQVFTSWKEKWDEARKEAELEAVLNSHESRLKSFSSGRKEGNMNAMDRARYHTEIGFTLRLWAAWKMYVKLESSTGHYKAKIDGKKSQLLGVQQMFRRFATELESNFRAGGDTTRDIRDGPPVGRRLQKSEGSVSLPDINQSSRRNQKPSTPNARFRTPTGSAYPSARFDASPSHQQRGAYY
mmetsp:Transcript_99584/g.316106  ORF Transcript_99584/g.316106 Transcript_99584/m.316106 type:complete len:584 (+) Transcript_99584:72-1823(+)